MAEASEQPKTPMELAYEEALKKRAADESREVKPLAGGSSEKLPGSLPAARVSGGKEKGGGDFTAEQKKVMRQRAGLASHFKEAGGLKEKGYKSEGFKEPGGEWWRLTHSEVIGKTRQEMETDLATRAAKGIEGDSLPAPELALPPKPAEPPPPEPMPAPVPPVERRRPRPSAEEIRRGREKLKVLYLDYYRRKLEREDADPGDPVRTEPAIAEKRKDIAEAGASQEDINWVVREAMRESGYLAFLKEERLAREGKIPESVKLEEEKGELLTALRTMYEDLYGDYVSRSREIPEADSRLAEIRRMEAEALELGVPSDELNALREELGNSSGYFAMSHELAEKRAIPIEVKVGAAAVETAPPAEPAAEAEAEKPAGVVVTLADGDKFNFREEYFPVFENMIQEREEKVARGEGNAEIEAELDELKHVVGEARRLFGLVAVAAAETVETKPKEEVGVETGEPTGEKEAEPTAPPPSLPPEHLERDKYFRIRELRAFLQQSREELKQTREILVEAKKNRKQNPESYEQALVAYQEKRANYVQGGVLRMLKERERLAALEVETNPAKIGRIEKMWRAWGEVALVPQSWRDRFERTAFGKTRLGQVFIRSLNMRTALSLSLWGAAAASGFGTAVGMIALGARSGLGAAGTYFGSQAFMEGLAQKFRFSVSKDKLEELSHFDFGGGGEEWDRKRNENMGFLESEMARMEAASMLAGRNVEEVSEYRRLKNTYLKYAKTFREKTAEGLRPHLNTDAVMDYLDKEVDQREQRYKFAAQDRRVIAGALAALFPVARIGAYLEGFDEPAAPKVPVVTPEWPKGIPELPKIIKPEPTGTPLPPTPTPPEVARAMPPPVITHEALPTPKGWPTPEAVPALPAAPPAPEATLAPRVETPKVLPTPEPAPPVGFSAVETKIRGILDPEFAPRLEDLEHLDESLGYVSKIKKGGSIWQAGLELVDSGKIKKSEFLRAWKNSFVKIRGEEVPLYRVGLTHEGDIVTFVPGEKPRFEFIPAGKMPAGTDEDLFRVYKKLGKEPPEWLRRSVGAEVTGKEAVGGSAMTGEAVPAPLTSAAGAASAEAGIAEAGAAKGASAAEAGARASAAAESPAGKIVESAAVSPAEAAVEATRGGAASVKSETFGLVANPEVAQTIEHFRGLRPVDQEGMIERWSQNSANKEVVELLLKDATYQEALRRFEGMRGSLIPAEEYEKIKDMPVKKFLASVAEAKNAAEEADRVAVVGGGKWKIAKAIRALAPDPAAHRISLEKILKIIFWEFPEYLQD